MDYHRYMAVIRGDNMPARGPIGTYPPSHDSWERKLINSLIWLAVISAVATLIALAILYTLQDEPEVFAPLEGPLYANEPIYIGTESARSGDILSFPVERCIDFDSSVIMFSAMRWVSTTGESIPTSSTFMNRSPGCATETVTLIVPTSLPSGTWHVDVIDGAIANEGIGIHIRTWRTLDINITRVETLPTDPTTS